MDSQVKKAPIMYVYRKLKPVWTVGFYDPKGEWHAESDHDSAEEAARRVRWLNGGNESRLTHTPRARARGARGIAPVS